MTTSRRALLPSILAVLALLSFASTASTAAADDAVIGPPAPPAVNATGNATVRLQVKSKMPAAVERRAPGEKAWVFQCTDPCDQDLPIAGKYRVVRDDRSGSQIGDTFTLDTKDRGAVTIDVQPTSAEGTAGGVLLTVPGAGISLVGLLGVAIGAQAVGRSCDGAGDWTICGSKSGGSIIATSAVVLLLGVGLTALGISVIQSSSAHVTKQRLTF